MEGRGTGVQHRWREYSEMAGTWREGVSGLAVFGGKENDG